MANPKWFDADVYMQNKLAQMQASDPDYSWGDLLEALAGAGYVGPEGYYAHFVQFGAAEDVAPNAYFDADEYYAAKAKQYYEEELKQEFTGSEYQIATVKTLINAAGYNAWTHYQQFGSAEGVNPSNAFDASDYCAAKAEAMNNAGQKAPDGTDWTAEKIAKAIDDAGMSVLEHYLTYAGTGEGEVAAGSTYPVSGDEQVSKPGETFTLTTGVDNLVGTAGDDVFSAVNDEADKSVLGAFDSIDGGAGNDTLNITDTAAAKDSSFSFPADFSMKSVENVTIATTGAINIDLSDNADVVSIKGDARGEAVSTVTASGNTDVALTVAGDAMATVSGGKAVSVTASTGGTGTTSVTGDSLTSVTIKGGANATIDNTAADTTTAKGTTLTSVVLDGVDGNSAIKGESLTDVTVKGVTSASRTVTITNAKEDHSLTVHVDGTGYKADGTEAQTTIVDAKATSMTVEASGEKSSLSLSGSSALENLTITGDAALKLNAELAALKAINGSAANGALTLGALSAATVDVQTGSGNDSFTIKATDKVTVDAGAGNDVVTLGEAIAAGSSIDLGAGDDTLLSASGSVAASTKDATTVIDGGDGFDSVSASLIDADNAAQFHNFEVLDLTAEVTGLDFALLTNSAIEALTLSGNNAAASIKNVAAGVDLRVSGDNSQMTTIIVKDAASGDADAFSVTLNETADAAAIAKLTVNGIENLTVEATGAGEHQNSLNVTDNALQTLTITGSQELKLTFTNTEGAKVSLIDGSAATGDLTIDTTNVTADDKLGLTVKTGSGADSITLAGKATVDAGAGDDTITSSAQGGTFTGGDGKDTFDVSAVTGKDKVTITDFVVGTDTLHFAAGNGKQSFTSDFVDVSEATSLSDALDKAAAATGAGSNSVLTWFTFGDKTYIVQDNSNSTSFEEGSDLVVELAGVHDLSGMELAGADLA